MGYQIKLNASGSRGFSLIEIMIVVAIIGLLAAIAAPNFISYRNKAYCSQAEADADIIAKEIGAYFAIPNHTTVDKTCVQAAGTSNKTWDIGASDPNLCITITVRDDSGRCPASYQKAMPHWDFNVYTKTFKI